MKKQSKKVQSKGKKTTKKVVVIQKPVETKPVEVKKPKLTSKPKKQYRATALLVLTIISLVIAASVFIIGIVLISMPNMQWYREGAQIVYMTNTYIWMIVDGALATIFALLALPARKRCTVWGLMLALGICNIVFCVSFVQLAMGIVAITHAVKIKRGLYNI